MKNFCTLFTLFLFAASLNAQVLFKQDFENGMDPMTLVDNDGKTPAPNVAAYNLAWNVANPSFGNGTNVAVSNSWYNPPAAADDWMITPALTISGANTVLKWEAKAQDPSYPDGYQVRISKTDMNLASFSDIVFSVSAEQTTWQERSLSLADYVGQTIHIAFRNNSNDQFLLLVDNIEVSNVLDKDIAVTKFNTTQFHLAGGAVAVEAEITNLGGQTLNSFDFFWSDGVNTYSENITGINLEYGESASFTHTNLFTVPETKSYNLTVWADNPNGDVDGYTDNNSTSGVVSGVTYIPAKKAVGEEGTGTWCQFCPRGTDWMEYMTVTYPDQFIGIAVHNGDPMVLAEYDNGSNFSAFPNAHLDRAALNIDPSEFEDFLPEYAARVAPVAPNVEATIDVATRTLTANASAEFVTELSGLDYRFSVVLVEDDVHGTAASYAQVNAYSGNSDPLPGWGYDWNTLANPAPASLMYYDHVGRAIMGGYAGTAGSIPADVTAGQVVTQNYTLSNFNVNWNPRKMHPVVLILDGASGEILNAEKGEEVNVVCPADFGATYEITDATTGNADGSIDLTPPSNSFGFGGYTYLWSNGAVTADVNDLTAGTYSVVITDRIGCSQTIDNIVVDEMVGVQDIAQLAGISLTPNPTNAFSTLTARFTEAVDIELEVISAAGQVVYSRNFDRTSNVKHSLDLGNFVEGLYLVKMTVGSQIHTERLLLAK